jgi:hypothetical protein
LYFSYVLGDIPDVVGAPPVDANVHPEEGFRVSNSVEVMNDTEPCSCAQADDSNDDCPVGELTESDIEMLQRIFPGRRDQKEFMSSWILLILIRRMQKEGMMSC